MVFKGIVISFLVWCGIIFYVMLVPSEPLLSCDILFFKDGKKIILSDVLIAKKETDIVKGLSKKREINNGMLFVWDVANTRNFWMKDTWVDLSIGFFDENNELFEIQDMDAKSLKIHTSSKKSKSALEVRRNQFKKIGLQVGFKIKSINCD